jgi:predicted secreted protein
MKRLLLLCMVVPLSACLLAGCGTEVKAYTDPGQTIDIGADSEFAILIALESNPSTGYSWQASYDESLLELVEESYELVGAGGTELFRFKALEKGEAEITMVYKRPWETEILEQKVFTVDVK